MPEPYRNPGPANEAAFDRIRDFIIEAAESGREPQPGWRDALHDVAKDLDKLAYQALARPDSVNLAATAMSSLAGVWLDVDQTDRLILGTLGEEGEAFADLVSEHKLTCASAPTQYEGHLTDGRAFYFRYRFAKAQLGIGATVEDAVTDSQTAPEIDYGDPPYAGHVDEAEFKILFMRLIHERQKN